MDDAAARSENLQAATPVRRRRWALASLVAVMSWTAALWLIPAVKSYVIPGSEQSDATLLGFSCDGAVVTAVERTTGSTVGAWRWELPSLTRSELWSESVGPTSRLEMAGLHLRDEGRWLLVAPLRRQPRFVIDVQTGQRLELEALLQREKRQPNWEPIDDGNTGSEVIDPQTGRSLGRIIESAVHAVSPDGRWTVGETGKELRVWKITKEGTLPTGIRLSKPEPPLTRNYVGWAKPIVQGELPCVAFSEDGQRVTIYGHECLQVYQLETEKLLMDNRHLSVFGLSEDRRTAYALRYDTFARVSLVDLAEETFDAGLSDWSCWPVAQAAPWVLVAADNRLAVSRPMSDVTLGPINVVIKSSRGAREHALAFVNMETKESVLLPGTAIPVGKQEFVGGWQIAAHSGRFAIQSQGNGTIRMFETPLRWLWPRRVCVALLLFALPGWWCLSNKSANDGVAATAPRIRAPSGRQEILTVNGQ